MYHQALAADHLRVVVHRQVRVAHQAQVAGRQAVAHRVPVVEVPHRALAHHLLNQYHHQAQVEVRVPPALVAAVL